MAPAKQLNAPLRNRALDSLKTKTNPDGTVTDTYGVEVFARSNARQGSFDRTLIYYIEYDATYYFMDGNIRITSVKGTAMKSVSYASFQGSKAVVAHQGIAGSAKCHAEALFYLRFKNIGDRVRRYSLRQIKRLKWICQKWRRVHCLLICVWNGRNDFESRVLNLAICCASAYSNATPRIQK